MTKKMKEAVKKLEESPFVDIQAKTAFSLHERDFIVINGFSKERRSHLNCTLKQKTIFQFVQLEGVSAGPRLRAAETPSFLQQNVSTC